ncbi:MAG: NrtA/SsuA/CpmA family ABC transporter substrate-binding protein [Actinomycetota bacterium]|nr:NrtA/SsuA/CpmA family ABC transporter substrate-binding protein [Actinomycetota bacterium]
MTTRMQGRRTALALVASLMLAGCSAGAATSAPGGAGGTTAAGAQSAAPQGPPTPVRIGLDAFGGAVVVYVAQQQGFFAKHHLNVTIQTYSVGLDTLNAALTGSEDFGWAFDFGSLGAMRTNRLRYVAVLTRTQPGFDQLAVRTATVKSPADLKGKKMGISAGTQQDYITVKYLQKIGVPVSSVQLLNFGTPLEMVAALETGQIDGAWLYGQAIQEAQKAKSISLIASDSAVISHGLGLLIGSTTFLQQHPDTTQRLLAALIDAEKWLDQDPSKNIETAATYIAAQLKAPVSGVLANIKTAQQTVSFQQSDVSYLEQLATFLNQVTSSGSNPSAAPLDVSQYIDAAPLRAVDPSAVSLSSGG